VLVIRLLRSLTPSGPPSLRSDVLSATPQVNHPDTSPDFLHAGGANQNFRARKGKPETVVIQTTSCPRLVVIFD
jgi:hypothetical protein